MKKISGRALSVILIAFLVIAGLSYFIYLDYTNGQGWAEYFSVYNAGAQGTIYDRDGVKLARFNGSTSSFSQDALTRIANYHVTGDYWGRTGTGVLSRYWQNTQSYSFVNGTTRVSNSVLDLTVSSDLNKKAYQLLNMNGKGCIMMTNYKTGEVLVMASYPSIDPADSDPDPEDGAYINRCLSAAYTPGSTFKLVTAAAAIENLSNLDSFSFFCEGEYDIAGVTISCTTAHGQENFAEALANSCNCAFAKLTVALGQDTMVKYVSDYGFLSAQTLSDLPAVAGTYPTEFVGDPELAWSGIGQSTDTVCPYTLLRYVSSIACGGEFSEPKLVKNQQTSYVSLVNPDTAAKMQQLMRNNVITHYDGDVNFPGLELCAKTGTAETGDGTSHSWFVGFLQDDEHPYAFVSLVENGGYGLWTAGLMMNDLLQYAVK